ncbi:uncharacterized protein METZ01_LOCUS1917 [marine metagenome]|uniref:Uncharacterized protein n=1 Tax=marine metagenome TaxID=408172 RepID=A0A381N627_9ZZZZ
MGLALVHSDWESAEGNQQRSEQLVTQNEVCRLG